jgi:hypothetical protein
MTNPNPFTASREPGEYPFVPEPSDYPEAHPGCAAEDCPTPGAWLDVRLAYLLGASLTLHKPPHIEADWSGHVLTAADYTVHARFDRCAEMGMTHAPVSANGMYYIDSSYLTANYSLMLSRSDAGLALVQSSLLYMPDFMGLAWRPVSRALRAYGQNRDPEAAKDYLSCAVHQYVPIAGTNPHRPREVRAEEYSGEGSTMAGALAVAAYHALRHRALLRHFPPFAPPGVSEWALKERKEGSGHAG